MPPLQSPHPPGSSLPTIKHTTTQSNISYISTWDFCLYAPDSRRFPTALALDPHTGAFLVCSYQPYVKSWRLVGIVDLRLVQAYITDSKMRVRLLGWEETKEREDLWAWWDLQFVEAGELQSFLDMMNQDVDIVLKSITQNASEMIQMFRQVPEKAAVLSGNPPSELQPYYHPTKRDYKPQCARLGSPGVEEVPWVPKTGDWFDGFTKTAENSTTAQEVKSHQASAMPAKTPAVETMPRFADNLYTENLVHREQRPAEAGCSSPVFEGQERLLVAPSTFEDGQKSDQEENAGFIPSRGIPLERHCKDVQLQTEAKARTLDSVNFPNRYIANFASRKHRISTEHSLEGFLDDYSNSIDHGFPPFIMQKLQELEDEVTQAEKLCADRTDTCRKFAKEDKVWMTPKDIERIRVSSLSVESGSSKQQHPSEVNMPAHLPLPLNYTAPTLNSQNKNPELQLSTQAPAQIVQQVPALAAQLLQSPYTVYPTAQEASHVTGDTNEFDRYRPGLMNALPNESGKEEQWMNQNLYATHFARQNRDIAFRPTQELAEVPIEKRVFYAPPIPSNATQEVDTNMAQEDRKRQLVQGVVDSTCSPQRTQVTPKAPVLISRTQLESDSSIRPDLVVAAGSMTSQPLEQQSDMLAQVLEGIGSLKIMVTEMRAAITALNVDVQELKNQKGRK